MITCLPYLMSMFIMQCLLFLPEDRSNSGFLPNDIYLLYDTTLTLILECKAQKTQKFQNTVRIC